jgi:hypothetical protein
LNTQVYFRYTPISTKFTFEFIRRPISPILSPSSRTFVELTLVNWRRPWGSRRLDFVIRAGSFNFFIDKISKFFIDKISKFFGYQQQPDRFNRISDKKEKRSSVDLTSGTVVPSIHEFA